ncbi:MAG: leucine-rich repeat protein [Candidatus Limousia pullorum]
MLKKMLSVLMAASMLLSVFAVSLTSARAAESPQITGVTGYAESEDPTRVMGDAVDGNTETFWHTKFNSNEVNFETDTKNSYYLDLGAEYFVDKFEYVPKQRADKNGKITDFKLYGTLDTDRETAQWTEIADVTGWTYGTSGEGTESHSIDIAEPKTWRMLRITVSGSTSNDGDTHDFICAAEFRVFGTEEPAETPVWEYEAEGDSVRIINYKGTDTNVVIPETIDGKEVSSIGSMNTSTSVFKEAYDKGIMIESVETPDTVVLINQHAFRGIASLKTVKLSQNLTEIRTSAFLDCSSLEKIDIPATVTEIGNNAFIGCEALKTVIIRGKNTYINNAGAGAYTAAFGFMEISQKTKIEGITMVGVEKSTAQNYTKKYPHIAFMTIEDYEGGGKLLGDVDGDGEIKIADATLLQQYLVKVEVENFNIEVADVNEDGKVDILDVTSIQIILATK